MTSSQNGKTQGAFEVFDATLAQATPDVLGIWSTISPAPPTELPFDTTAGTYNDVPCWRASLPADLRAANGCLREGETRLLRSQQALPGAADRLASLVRSESSYQAFSVFTATALQPEAELVHLLHTLQEPSASFGLIERFSDEWNKVTQQWQVFIDTLLHAIAHYAWIETYAGEQLVGRTGVSWTGDMETVWRAELDSDQAALHQRTLALALASRQALLQLFLLVARGSVMVSTLFTVPAGPLLVLPAIWQFVQLVLAEDDGAAPPGQGQALPLPYMGLTG